MEYVINTPCGKLQGVSGKNPGTAAYKGIRYATAGRWEYPVQVTSWEGVYDATSYGACSYQPRAFYNEEENLKKVFYYNEFRKGETYSYDEDCLFLNVFTPDTAKEGDKLPVLIYIHGGGFTGGCGHEKHFDEPVWPMHGVIGVTLNYRLGPMGFLTLPELKEEAGYTGNYGLFDQTTAIRWVKDNIAAFGGDPENMTIMGQSAGAMSVQQQSLSPMTKGLFQKAVMSSGAGVSKMLSAAGPEKAYDFWHAVMKHAGCEDLAAFRAITPEQLFASWDAVKKEMKGGGCFPCKDGRLIVGTGVELLKDSKQHMIPYMTGVTSEDMMPPILYDMAAKWVSAQPVPSYLWFFDRQLPGDEAGAWHSSDLWYWFGTLDNCWRPFVEKDKELSEQMVTYLMNFVRSGNPGGGETPSGKELPEWKAASAIQPQSMHLGEGKTKMDKPNKLKMIKTMLTNKAVGE